MDEFPRCVAWDLPVSQVIFGLVQLMPSSAGWSKVRAAVLWDSCLHDGEFLVYFSAIGVAEVRMRVEVWPEGQLEMNLVEMNQAVVVEFTDAVLTVRYAELEDLGYPCRVGGCMTLVEPKGSLIRMSAQSTVESSELALTVSAVFPSDHERQFQRMEMLRALRAGEELE